MNAKRLLKLAEFLQHMPKQKFNFGLIAAEGEKPMLEALKARRSHCGTVACAIGWMPAVFPRLTAWDKDYETLSVMLKKAPSVRNFSAAERLFGITPEEAAYLFEPYDSQLGEDATAKEVAKHIREFVKRGGKPAEDDDNEYDTLVNERREYD